MIEQGSRSARAVRYIIPGVVGVVILSAILVGSAQSGGSLILLGLAWNLPSLLIYARFTRSLASAVVAGAALTIVVAYIFRNPTDTIVHPSDLFGLTLLYLGLLHPSLVESMRTRKNPSLIESGCSSMKTQAIAGAGPRICVCFRKRR